MSDKPEAKPAETKAAAPEAAAPAPKKGGGGLAAVVGIILPAILAAGGAFAAAKTAGAHAVADAGHAEPKKEAKAPGPTIPLEPFLVTVPDSNKKAHAMKLTLAIEFESMAKEDVAKVFTPRIRDAVLSYMRQMTYEDAVDSQHSDKFRTELLERCQKIGATSAERVLITDMVIQ